MGEDVILEELSYLPTLLRPRHDRGKKKKSHDLWHGGI